MENTPIKMEDYLEMLESIDIDFDNPSLIQNNKSAFMVENKMYRCNMPSQYETSLAYDMKNKLYTKLIKEGEYLTTKQIKKYLKENQDIDIEGIEKEKLELENEIKNLYLVLVAKVKENKEDIEDLKSQIGDIKARHLELSIEVSNHISASIEQRVEKEYLEFLTCLCTDKLIENSDNKWIKVWDDWEYFKKDNTKIANKAVAMMASILIGMRD